MSGLKESLKGGWHPKGKDGKGESWHGDFKGINQVAGWLGKGKDPNEAAKEHVSRPISSLKDPASFGPPPKNVNYHGGAALPNQTTLGRGGVGTPLTSDEVRREEEVADMGEDERKSLPFRVNTTSHLPSPPMRSDSENRKRPAPAPKPKPGLPPRLPPRQDSSSRLGTVNPSMRSTIMDDPPAHKGILNQGSINRLGASGISVPGFGIGGKQALPPPQLPASPTRSPRASSPSVIGPTKPNNSQLNELQSRFSRLGTSSPKPEAPSQGTSLAQKQAALQTAASFRKDPSSVSFADARAAASTANNFRERHGDQVAAGWKSANKLDQKYGVSDKLQGYSNANADDVPIHTEPKIDVRDSASASKKPPPLPPKKPALHSIADTGSEPPLLPLTSKPKPKITGQSPDPRFGRKGLDFDLKSLWFAKSPPTFPPPSISQLPGDRSTAFNYGWGSPDGIRRIHFFTGAIRHNYSMETTKIHLTWDESNPGLTVKEQQKHIPPPRALEVRELELFRKQYAERIASWCESKVGQQVGNGECWTLAADALSSIANELRARNKEPCMTSQGFIHGYQIYCCIPPKPSDPLGGVNAAGVARGDIVQFLSTRFEKKDGTGWTSAGAPDHTAVVTAVEPGGALKVLEQNMGGIKRVGLGRYDPVELVTGELRVFRAVGESWVRPLDTEWP